LSRDACCSEKTDERIMNQRHHVAVIGAGLVGTATALALARNGLKVALIEPRPAPDPARTATGEAGVPDAAWDIRVYAISPGNEALLEALGAWPRLDMHRVQTVFRMDVRGDAGGHLRLDSYETGVPKLASILESDRLQLALWQAARQQDNIDVHCPAGVTGIDWRGPHPRITLDTGTVITPELVVGADGIQSAVREFAGLRAAFSPYGQSGVVANFATERAHGGTAFQCFRDGDIVAYLPLPGNRMSLVWSTATEHAQSLLELEPEAFCAKVQEAGQSQLGKLSLLTPPAAFPLRLMQPSAVVRPGCALVGDAAHGVHPLAGQGVNLGFGDVAALAQVLSQRGRASCGDLNLLERYARRRAEPVARMQFVTDSLWRLFGMEYPLAAAVRNAGMSALNTLGPIKSSLVHEALFS
jgi:2-polyprenylphenol 6-hydroxylase